MRQIDLKTTTFWNEELSGPQINVLVNCIDNQQMPIIKGVELKTSNGTRLSPMPGGYLPAWWHDNDPTDLWEGYSAGWFHPKMVPDVISDLVIDEASAMGAPREALLAGCIASVAGALNDQVKVEAKLDRNWFESGRLWQAVISKSGTKKSPAMRVGMEPLRTLESDFAATDAAGRIAHEVEMKRHDRHIRALEKSDEPFIAPIPPRQPDTHRFIVSNTTVEALGEILRHQPRGTTLYIDELARWLASIEGTGKASADRALYLEAYDGGPQTIDRIGRGIGIKVPNWSTSIIGGIQPTTLAKAMKDVPIDGMLQRFYPYICDMPKLATHEPQDAAVMERFNTVVRRVNRMFPGHVQVSPEAEDILNDAWIQLREISMQPSLSEPLQNHISKWEGGLYRWALILHAIECASIDANSFGMIMRPISEQTAEMVVRLHNDLFLPNLFVLYEQILIPTRQEDHAKWIAGHILKEGMTEITVREIYRAYKAFDNMDDFERLRILRNLEASGWIEQSDKFSKSYVPSHWYVNPKVHFNFEHQAEMELQRRIEIVQSINRLRSG